MDPDAVNLAWTAAQRQLPEGWALDGLRCASTGLTPEQRSDDWIAVALGPNGEERTHRGPDAIAALLGLVSSFA